MTLDLAALQALWRQRDRVVLLQIGFGTGDAMLQAWQGWRGDAQRRAHLHFIVIDAAPFGADTLQLAHPTGPLAALAKELAAHCPAPTRNLHRLSFDSGQVQLLWAIGTAMDTLPELRAQVDAFLIDTVDLSADPRQGARRLCKALARLASPGASLVVAWPQREIRAALPSAGFLLLEPNTAVANPADRIEPGDATADDPTIVRAIYSPRFTPRRRGPSVTLDTDRHALIVGAGLAGCAVACALAEQGWRSTLIDRHAGLAREGSGNPAGLFHGIVNVQDGAHARFNRAAALQASRSVQQAIDEHGAKGSTQGLLRLEMSGKDAATLHAELTALQLPGSYVQALGAAEASRRCGLPLQHPAWYYPGGGWVDPAALARSFLQRAGTAARFRGALAVQTLRREASQWQLLDAEGRIIDEAATVVLANAADALRLMQSVHWPVQRVRGQISLYANRAAPQDMKMRLPSLPLAGTGWLLPEIDGQALFGATSHPGDDQSLPRAADHATNLARLHALSPHTLPALRGPGTTTDPAAWSSKVGWRCVADDRLPLIGAVPDQAALAAGTVERVREVPRQPGLYVFSALASRGITWATLGGQILAAQISGAPVPLEASLLDAVDPARLALRSKRRKAVWPTAAPGA